MQMHEMELKQLKSLLIQINVLVQKGDIDIGTYHKSLVSAAHEAMTCADLQQMIEFLGQVPPTYYKEKMVADMEKDVAFESQVMEMATALVNTGTVVLGFSEEQQRQTGKA